MNKCICPPDAHDEACEVCIPTQRKITISSLYEMQDHIRANRLANFISIRDSSSCSSTFNKEHYAWIDKQYLDNCLTIIMDDIVYASKNLLETYPDIQIPQETQIKQIIDWSKQKRDENTLDFVIHCTAGVSRSSACAVIVQALINPENILKIIDPQLHHPNPRILKITSELLDMPDLAPTVENFYKSHKITLL